MSADGVRQVSEAHAAALAEVRQQLDLAEQELADERQRRKAIEHAAKQGAHEALSEQARWRAAAAEGWLTAGREAKRRQAAQLARMSDMLQLGGGGQLGGAGGAHGSTPLAERTNAAERSAHYSASERSAHYSASEPPAPPGDGGGGGLGAAWASPRTSPRASSPVPAAAEPDEAPWRASELLALQMASGGSPGAVPGAAPLPPYPSGAPPAGTGAGRCSGLAAAHAIGSPLGPARGVRPPRAATPKTRGAGAPPVAAPAAGRAVSGAVSLGAPLSSSSSAVARPPRVRYEDTVAADLD